MLAGWLLAGVGGVWAEQPAFAAAPAIREPLFDFLFTLAEDDSLGTWSGPDLAARLAADARASRFPLDQVVRVSRRPARPEETESRPDGRLERIWEVELAAHLDRPMPYSILGYHPGSLRVSRLLVLSEWRLGDLELRLRGDCTGRKHAVQDVRVLRLDRGWVVLDVDAWLDSLLGKALDDSWTLGFVFGWQGPVPLALAVNVGRQGRRLHGELDLVRDEILSQDRPLAGALSRHCRPLTAPPAGCPDRTWQETE